MTRTASEWRLSRDGVWFRSGADDELDAANVERLPGDVERWEASVDSGTSWLWLGNHPTAEAAKAAADARLVELGWTLL